MAAEDARREIQVLEEDEISSHPVDARELEEYAAHIGINLELDRDLLWIAAEGLRAVPPAPWKACCEKGCTEVFYFNFSTGESVWDHPSDDMFREKVLHEMATRVLLPLTLVVQAQERGHVLRGINLAGNVACQVEVADLNTAVFADVEDGLLTDLFLQSGTVPRFILPSAGIISHSRRMETLAQLLEIPR
jgi:centrosomal protein CEP164